MKRVDARVLIVEDNDDLREDLAGFLREEGYLVVTAEDGDEALLLLRAGPPPSLVVLDLMMPRMNGWELRAEMLADPALTRIPVVVVSGAMVQDPASLQAAACLRKPYQLDELLEVLTRLRGPGPA
jgi:CheY-like chemotaxis protein